MSEPVNACYVMSQKSFWPTAGQLFLMKHEGNRYGYELED